MQSYNIVVQCNQKLRKGGEDVDMTKFEFEILVAKLDGIANILKAIEELLCECESNKSDEE